MKKTVFRNRRGEIFLPILFLFLAIVYYLLSATHSLALEIPPSGSPIALGQHPRLFFTASELPSLRDRIATYYRTEFQGFITMLNDTSALSSGQKAIESDWGSMNYAFIAALDPAEMQQRGFTFTSVLDTPQEYCNKAMPYALTKLSAISGASGQGHADLTTGYPTATYFPVLAAYDWCYSYASDADKQAIANAFNAAYNIKYAGKNVLTMDISGLDMIANNQVSADIHDSLGIVALYNDPYLTPAAQSAMYKVFHDLWINRVFVELDYFYKTGTGWHEGSGGYASEGFINLGIPVALFSSAMGRDYPSTMNFFSQMPLFYAANIKPHSFASGCGTSGTARCPEYMERWGTISGGIGGVGCKPLLLNTAMLQRSNHPNAAISKWVKEKVGGCTSVLSQYGGMWANGVLYQFLNGDRSIASLSPEQANAQKTQKMGLGEYVMKSDYSTDASQVIFWAQENNMYGHNSPEYGNFSLHKFGNLILTPANSKSGDAVISSAKSNIHRNVVGIHKGSSDSTMDFNSQLPDPLFGSRGISTVGIAGKLLADSINSGSFDYISYDNSASWTPSTANVSQRELVYLRGPLNKEYVVVFDRMNVLNPSTDEKVWKIWIPAQPVFENGAVTAPRTGKWTSSNSDTVSMTNKFSGLKTPNFESAPTHGKFFMKILSPQNPVINVLGGPGKEFQSGNDDGTTPWGAPTMTQGMHEYLGWGRIEVRPSVAQNYDVFLNVIQFGDSNTLSVMSPTIRVDSSDGKMAGSHIQDSGNQWVVMFAKNALDVANLTSITYALSGSGSINHLVTDLKKNVSYDIYKNGAKILTQATDGGGALSFNTSLGSGDTFIVQNTGSPLSGDTTPPTVSISAPSNGATVSGTAVTVSANASDNVGVAGVQFKLDGVNLGAEDATSPYSLVWNSATAANGSHSLTAVARDAAGNQATSPTISVTVSNSVSDTTPPVLSNRSPSGILPSGTSIATLSLNSNENATCKYATTSGVSYASMPNTFSTTGGTSNSTTVSGLSNGTSYNYYVRCQDASGNANTGDYGITFSVASSATPSPGIYVDNSVVSSGNGSFSSPYKTIQEGLNTATAGTTVFVRGDLSGSGRIYNETPSFPVSGTSGALIVLRSYSGEKVIISHSSSISLNKNYIVLDGLVFDHQNVASDAIVWGGNNNIMRNSEVRNGQRDGVDTVPGVSNMLIENSIFHDFKWITTVRNDAHCIVSDPPINNLSILNNTIYNCSGDGYQAYNTSANSPSSISSNILVQGNTIYSTLGPNAENALDFKDGSNITIRGNVMYGFTSSKTVVFQQYHNGITFEDNQIHDSGGVEFRGEPVGVRQSNITVRGNVIHDVLGTANYGLKFDGVDNLNVYNNTIADSPSKSIFVDVAGVNGGNLKNNLIYNSGSTSNSGSPFVMNVSNNGWFLASAGFLTSSSDTVGTDPKFVNVSTNDFHLTSVSPVIDRGVNVGYPFSGSSPDPGAYEFTGSNPPSLDTTPPAAPRNLFVTGVTALWESVSRTLANLVPALQGLLERFIGMLFWR